MGCRVLHVKENADILVFIANAAAHAANHALLAR